MPDTLPLLALLAMSPAILCPVMLKVAESSHGAISVTMLISIIVVCYLPAVRVWRSLGYHTTPPLLLYCFVFTGVTFYELTTRYYQRALATQGTSSWIVRRVEVTSENAPPLLRVVHSPCGCV